MFIAYIKLLTTEKIIFAVAGSIPSVQTLLMMIVIIVAGLVAVGGVGGGLWRTAGLVMNI